MTVSVVVPTFRRPQALERTLEALLDADYPPDRYEIIVVDDGSEDRTQATVEMIKEARAAGDRIRYISQDNSGAATARNRGAGTAHGDVLIFVDDDIIVAPDHFRRHLEILAENPHAITNGHWEFTPEVLAVLQQTSFGRFRIEVEEWVKATLPKKTVERDLVEPSAATACNLGIRRDFFWEIGGFDEHFPVAGYEDQEFSHRAIDAGARLLYDRSIRLLHNDQRATLEQFCERQRQGAMTAVYLAAKYPEDFADKPLITENSPIARGDGSRVAAKKVLKQVLSSQPGLLMCGWVIRSLESRAPESRLLSRLYWGVCGLHIFLGVRDGFAPVGSIPQPGPQPITGRRPT